MPQGRFDVAGIALALWPLVGLLGVAHGFLQANWLAAIGILIRRAVPQILAAIFFLCAAFWLKATPLEAIAATVIAHLVSVAFGLWLGLAPIAKSLRSAAPVYRRREWLGVSLPLLTVGMCLMLLRQTDIMLLGILDTSESAGIYAIASRIAEMISFGLIAAHAIAAPRIAQADSEGTLTVIQRTAQAAVLIASSVAIGGFLCAVFFGKWGLQIFGSGFAEGYLPLLILAGAQVINAGSGVGSSLLAMTGNHNHAAWPLGIAVILNLAMNIILIPQYGTIGAAIATSISLATQAIITAIVTVRLTRVNPSMFAWLTRYKHVQAKVTL